MTTGEPVWRHRDTARFWEANAGAGPRGTPTLSDGRVYTFGATGILNVLDAGDGAVVWSRNAASDTSAKVPYWGFASSPLVVDDVVIVAVEGALVAYDLTTGDPRWFGPDGGDGYSSPHLLTIDGVAQILLLSKAGAASVAPADGKLLWEHPWPGGTRIVQPALTADGNILISRGPKGPKGTVTLTVRPGGLEGAAHRGQTRIGTAEHSDMHRPSSRIGGVGPGAQERGATGLFDRETRLLPRVMCEIR